MPQAAVLLRVLTLIRPLSGEDVEETSLHANAVMLYGAWECCKVMG